MINFQEVYHSIEEFLMEYNIEETLKIFGTIIFFILIGWAVIAGAILSSKKKKLRAGSIPYKNIEGRVELIEYYSTKYTEGSSITAIAKNPITQQEEEFFSDNIPYKGNKIRLFSAKESEVLGYVRTYIKEGDSINIRISLDEPNVYYLDIPNQLY